ncbi:MAG: transglutaminase-like domain-containing protein [Gemmataceae bacterium]
MIRRLFVLIVASTLGNAAHAADAQSRSFEFTYQGTLTGLPAGKLARVWLPVPSSNADQEVTILDKQLPGKEQLNTEKTYGNRILFFEARASDKGEVPFSVTYRITRREVKGLGPVKESNELLERYLKPDAVVPIAGKPLELIKDRNLPDDPMQAARVLYDVVNKHMRYAKEGTEWGRGDSVWACQSGFGNCSDFHSLFISLARSQKIPAKFEIGFPLPEQRGSGAIPGYHCWAKFKVGDKGWVPVDISEASKNPKLAEYYFGNLTADRVAFSTGRDLELVPRQAGKPINFLIYPYAEVDGQPVGQDKIKKQFSFKDLDK